MVLGVLLFVLLLLAISLHELGHAFAMRRYGIEMKEICLIGLGPKLASFKVPVFGDTPVTIRLIPLAAFVMPSEEGVAAIKNLPYSARAEIYGSGIAVNLALMFVYLAAGIIVAVFEYQTSEQMGTIVWFVLGCFSAALVVMLFRKSISAWILPFLTLPILGFIAWGLVTSPPSETLGGPVAIYDLSSTVVAKASGVSVILVYGALISFAIGASNLLPFVPFDGAHLGKNFLRLLMGDRRYERTEGVLTIGLAIPGLILIVLSLAFDVWRLAT